MKLPTLLAVVAVVTGCSGTAETTIPAQNPGLVAEGEQLYAASCAECHGADLRGTDRGPSHLSEVYEPGHHGDGAFLVAVTAGVRPHHWDFGAMPPIEGLSAQDIVAVVAFVREQQRIQGFEPYPP